MYWIGNQERTEFVRLIHSLFRDRFVHFVDSLNSLPNLCANNEEESILCFAHESPGVFSDEDISSARFNFPNATVLHFLGGWCCGIKRTSKPLAEFPTFYAHEVQGSVTIDQLLAQVNFDSKASINLDPRQTTKLFVVYSPDNGFRAGIIDSVAHLGMKSIEAKNGNLSSVRGVDFVVWDVPGDASRRVDCLNELERIRSRHGDAKILALMTFPRDYEVACLQHLGVKVLAKPFDLNRLVSFFYEAADVSVSSVA